MFFCNSEKATPDSSSFFKIFLKDYYFMKNKIFFCLGLVICNKITLIKFVKFLINKWDQKTSIFNKYFLKRFALIFLNIINCNSRQKLDQILTNKKNKF